MSRLLRLGMAVALLSMVSSTGWSATSGGVPGVGAQPDTASVAVPAMTVETFTVGRSPRALTFDGANVWVVNAGSDSVSKLRAADGQLVGTYPTGPGPTAVAFDGTHIWVTNGDDTISKLASSDGSAVATYPVENLAPPLKWWPTVDPGPIVFDGTHIWVSTFSAGLQQLDPTTGTRLGSVWLPAYFGNLAADLRFDGSRIWATTNGKAGQAWITSVDPSDGTILSSASVPTPGESFGGVGGLAAIAFGGDRVWATDVRAHYIVELDASDGSVITTHPIGPGGSGMVFDGVDLWVTGENTVHRISPSSGVVIGTYPVGEAPSAVAFDGDAVWVTNEGDGTVTRLSGLIGTQSEPEGPYAPSGDYVAMVPVRLMDTRQPASPTVDGRFEGVGVRAAGSMTELQVGGRAGVPVDAAAVVLNVTATGAEGSGFVTVWPCGGAMPNASNLNFSRGQTIPNAVIAQVGEGGAVCVFTETATHLVVDVGGYYPVGSPYVAMVPVRLMDTRQPASPTVDGRFEGVGVRAAGSMTELQVGGRAGVPVDAAAVVLNVTATGAEGSGFVTVWPCGGAMPNASNLNFSRGQTIPNAVIAQVGEGGAVCVFTETATHLVVDVGGYYRVAPMKVVDQLANAYSTADWATVRRISVNEAHITNDRFEQPRVVGGDARYGNLAAVHAVQLGTPRYSSPTWDVGGAWVGWYQTTTQTTIVDCVVWRVDPVTGTLTQLPMMAPGGLPIMRTIAGWLPAARWQAEAESVCPAR